MSATNPRIAQILTLASSLADKAPLASPTFTGTVSGVTSTMVGLGNVDNTSDANKPVSTATQTELDLKASTTEMNSAIAAASAGVTNRSRARAATTADITISTALNDADTLDGVTLATGDLVLVKNQTAPAENGIYVVGSSPARAAEFDTYNDHPGAMIGVSEGTVNLDSLHFCTSNSGGTLGTTAINFTKLVIAGELLAANNLSDLVNAGTSRTNLGLGNVDNTSDANKPVSTATQDELDLKAPLASPTFTGTVSGITKTMVGLGNVDNTSDANKPVSTATETELDLKAPLASPTFTGTPTLPTGTIAITQSAADSTTALATTAFVTTADNLKANLASPTFTGTVTTPAIVISSETASRIASFDGSSSVKALSTATYPDLTELSYIKGATSAIQTQIDNLSGGSGVELSRFVMREIPNQTPDGSIAAFTVDDAMATNSEQVYLNGLLQEPGGEDYTRTNSTTVTFATAPATGDRVRISYIKAS